MTWAVNPAELAPMIQAAATGRILSWRLLTDGDFLDLNTDGKRTSKKAQKRAEQLRALTDVVLTRNHAKAAIVANAEWSLVATGSMNLTRNPRLELIEAEQPGACRLPAGPHRGHARDLWRGVFGRVEPRGGGRALPPLA